MNLSISSIYFDELVHGYITADGQLLTGVTTLLKEMGLAPSYDGISEDVLALAAERGTAIHKDLEAYDNGLPVIEDENLKAYRKMLSDNELSVIASEYLVNDAHIASMVDKVLADYSLADVKTTSKVHTPYVRWQLSIYKYLFELMNPSIVVPHLYIFHVRGGKAKCIEVAPIPQEEVDRLFSCWIDGQPYHAKAEQSLMPADDAKALMEIESALDYFSEIMESLKEQKAAILEKVEEEVAKLGEVDMGDYVIKYKQPYERITLDSAKIKDKHPEIFEKYQKSTIVKGSISISIK